ncbi:hypothetical protein B0H11DRAFT_2312814 [Mycena galericulata]|nr:hypothetical protein B0H11DRAFT_2312814 [Mycena galericulata]
MYRTKFHSNPSTHHLHLENDETAADDFKSADTLSNSSRTLLQTSRQLEGPKKSPLGSSKALRLLSLSLHSMLVAIHLVLTLMYAKGLEHRSVFSLDKQRIVSLAITAISTTVGTIYSALLVFVTQTLSTRRNLRMKQTLTATHDTAAAWAGIGSAVAHMWHQKAVPSSVVGVLSAFLYLGNILVLHITTPALFSAVAFNSSQSAKIGTESLPAFNYSGYSPSNASSIFFDVADYASRTLTVLPSILGSTENLGLHFGTLYDILDDNSGTGDVTTNATGFNITCGYLSDVGVQFDAQSNWLGSSDGLNFYVFPAPTGVITIPGIVSTTGFPDSLIVYTTIPIVDSRGTQSPSTTLDPPFNNSVSAIQIFRCSQTLVNQTAVVDAQSHKILAVEPDIAKTTSSWGPYSGPDQYLSYSDMLKPPNPLISAWSLWYASMPPSDVPINQQDLGYLSVAELYLIQRFNLHPPNQSDAPSNVTLHDLENALSILVASMFYTLGSSPPGHGTVDYANSGSLPYFGIQNVTKPVSFLRGTAMVTQISTQGRLDLSIIAVSVGLAASVALLLLSLPTSLVNTGSGGDSHTPIGGTGILHSIWLYRNHPELEILLEQVEHPTDQNLREAGMVQTRLVGAQIRHRRYESS